MPVAKPTLIWLASQLAPALCLSIGLRVHTLWNSEWMLPWQQELIREVQKSTKVLTVTGMPMLYESLEVLQQQLVLCEKALAEYLETKRLAFPRFYFVSSADLLDILSNGNNPSSVRMLFQRNTTLLLFFYRLNENWHEILAHFLCNIHSEYISDAPILEQKVDQCYTILLEWVSELLVLDTVQRLKVISARMQ